MRRLLLAATLGVVAFALGVGPAGATTVTPAGVDYEGSLATPVTFAIGTNEVVCDVSSLEGAVPAEPDNEAIGSPVTFDVDVPTFDDCAVLNHGGMGEVVVASATVTANDVNGSWEATFDASGSPTAELVVPEAGLEIDVPAGSCTITAAPSAAEGIVGDWTTQPVTEEDSQLTFSGDELAISSPGGACGSETSMFVSATYDVSNVTSEIPIQVENQIRRKWWANNQPFAGAGEAKSETETPTKLKFTWPWFASTNVVECKFTLTPSLTNTPLGTGTISNAQVSITDCNWTLMQTCTLTSIQAHFPDSIPWSVRGYQQGGQDKIEIGHMEIRMAFQAQGGACQLAGAASPHNWVGHLKPLWTNGAGGAHSWAEFKGDGTTGNLIRQLTRPRIVSKVEGKLRWKTGAGNVLTLVAP